MFSPMITSPHNVQHFQLQVCEVRLIPELKLFRFQEYRPKSFHYIMFWPQCRVHAAMTCTLQHIFSQFEVQLTPYAWFLQCVLILIEFPLDLREVWKNNEVKFAYQNGVNFFLLPLLDLLVSIPKPLSNKADLKPWVSWSPTFAIILIFDTMYDF